MSAIGELQPRMFGRLPQSPFEILQPSELTILKKQFTTLNRGFIMVDLDGVLINEEEDKPTSLDIFDSIKMIQEAGFMICLNSARSIPTLRKWQKMFSTNEPNFAEFGRLVDFPTLNWQIVFHEKALLYFATMRQHVVDKLIPSLSANGFDKIALRMFAEEEPADFIRKTTEAKSWPEIAASCHYGIYLNYGTKLRLGLRAPKITEKGPVFDERFYSAVLEHLHELERDYPFGEPLSYKQDKKNSVIVAHAGIQEKTYSWRILLSFLTSFLGEEIEKMQFYHLGNGKEDIIEDTRVKLLTVSNGNDELLAKASHVSQYSTTSGAVDNLRWILNQSNLTNF